jgi:hypothetical protein
MRSSSAGTAVLLGAALLAAGCAAQPGGGSSASPSSSTAAAEGELPDDGGLALQVSHVGGFLMPPTTVTQLPLVSVYADGRVITEGPVIAIYPGPALPNLQVATIPTERVEELVQLALDAGVGEEFDYGMPPVADVPSTRFTVVTQEGTETTEVYALAESTLPGGPADGLSEEQIAARGRMQDLLEQLTPADPTESYEAEAVAAVATPWTDPDDGMTAEDPPVAWPGPALPGEPLPDSPDLTCVTADGAAAEAVLEAAADATALTPWTTDDGSRWSLTLRPLLPHESSCADLPSA